MQRRRLFQNVFIVGALLALVTYGLRTEYVGDKVCTEVRELAPKVSGLSVHIGKCQLEPWELGVDLRDVEVSLQSNVRATVRAERAALKLQLIRGLLDRSLGRIELVRPTVDLDLSHLLDEPKAPSPKHTCRLNELVAEIPLGNISILEGRAHLTLPDSKQLDLQSLDLNVRSHHGIASVRLSEAGGQMTFEGGEVPLDKIALSASLDTQEHVIDVSRLDLVGGQLSVLAHASARDLCDPDLQVEASVGVPVDLVSALLHSKSFSAQGYVTANVRMGGKLDHPNAHAELEVNDLEMMVLGQHLDPRDFTASLDLRDNRLELNQFYWPLGDGYGRISGALELHDSFPFTASIEGKNIPFGELLNHLPLKHPWVDSLASVKSKQTGHLFPTPTFTGPVVADFNDFHIRTRAWDAPPEPGDEILGFKHEHIEANFDFTPERIHLTKVHLTGPTADLTADALLSTDTQKGLDLTADLNSLDLAEVNGLIAGLPWKGRASAHAHITGPYGKQIIDANLAIQDFTMVMVHLGDTKGSLHFDPSLVLRFEDVVAVKNGHTAYGGDGLLDFSHGGGPVGGGDVRLTNGRVEDLLDVLRDVHWAFDMLDGQLTGLVSGSIHLKPSPILAPTSDFDLHFSQVSLYQRPMGSTEFVMHTQDGDSITIPPLTIDGTLGTLTFGGWQRVGGELNYQLTLKGVLLPVATAPELTTWDVNGTLDGTLTITGPSAQARILGDLYGNGLSIFGIPLGYGHVRLHDEGPSMSLVGSVGNDVTLDMRMRWEGDLPMRAHLAFDVADLFPYVPTAPAWNDVSGQVHGTLDVTGNMKDSTSYQGQFTFPTIRVSKGDFTEENRGPVRLGFQGDTFEIQSLSFMGHREGDRSANTQFSLGGTRSGEDDRLALHFDGRLDGRLIETVFPYVENTAGDIALTGKVTGTQAHPELVGSMQIEHGHLKVRDQAITADGLQGRVVFSQNNIDIPEGITGTINRGAARLSGDVTLLRFSPSTYDLQLTMDDSRFVISDWPAITLRGSLEYAGPASNPSVSGNLDVRNFLYNENLTLPRVLASMRDRKLDAHNYTRGEHLWTYDGLILDLAQEPDDSVRIDTNLVKTSLRGHLAVSGDNAQPVLRGRIDAQPGAQAFWQGNTYSLNQLALEFSGKEGLVPQFDAHATSQVREYNVAVHAFGVLDGNSDHYSIEPSSNPSLDPKDLFTLLNLGFTTQDRGGTNDQIAGFAGAGINGLSTLTGLDAQAQKFLPKDGSVVSDPTFRLTTTYSLRVGSMEPTAQLEGKIFGKLLKDRLRFHLEQQAGTSNATKAQVELRMNDSMSLKGLYDGDNSDQYTFPDVGADLQFHTVVK